MLLNISKTTIPQAIEQGYRYAMFIGEIGFNIGFINLELFAEKVNSKTFLNQTQLIKYFDLENIKGPSLKYFHHWMKEMRDELGEFATLIGFVSSDFKFKPYTYDCSRKPILSTEFDTFGLHGTKITESIDKILVACILWLKEIHLVEESFNSKVYWSTHFHNSESLIFQDILEGFTSSFSENFKNKTIEDIEKECLTYGADLVSTP